VSRRVTLTPSGLATVYCCDRCDVQDVRSQDGHPKGWLSTWETGPAAPGVMRWGHRDLCTDCRVAAALLDLRPTASAIFASV